MRRRGPVSGGLECSTRLRVVVRHHFRFHSNAFRVFRLKGLPDTPVQLLPLAPQQTGIRGILQQRMLELERCRRLRAALKCQSGRRERCECEVKFDRIKR